MASISITNNNGSLKKKKKRKKRAAEQSSSLKWALSRCRVMPHSGYGSGNLSLWVFVVYIFSISAVSVGD